MEIFPGMSIDPDVRFGKPIDREKACTTIREKSGRRLR